MADPRCCYYCKQPGNLRPYGPGGSWVCAPCVSGGDAREDDAASVFLALLDAAQAMSPIGVVVDAGSGPEPLVPEYLGEES